STILPGEAVYLREDFGMTKVRKPRAIEIRCVLDNVTFEVNSSTAGLQMRKGCVEIVTKRFLLGFVMSKKDMRAPNSMPLGNSMDSLQKGLDGSQDKKEWKRATPEIETSHRWREEERDTSLLGRKERMKDDRRADSGSGREEAACLILSVDETVKNPKVRRRVHKEMLLLERWVEGMAGQVSMAVEGECEGVELLGFEDAKDFLE
ncbi:hypothetical protein IFM89_000802, partial [Coptis chinensis]